MGSMDRDRPGARGDRIEESVWGVPAPALRPFIAGYAGFRQAGVPPATHRGLPSPYLTVIFTLDDPLTIAAHADPRQPPASYRSLVGGLHTSPALITHQGRQSGIQLLLSPLGARALLGMPAAELASIDVEGSEVLGLVGLPKPAERLGRAVYGFGLAGAAVQPDWLGYLVADGLGRVQRGERILEDHRDVVAAQPAQLGLGQAD